MREWRNWQTRTFEGSVICSYGFKSRFSHQNKKDTISVSFLFSCIMCYRDLNAALRKTFGECFFAVTEEFFVAQLYFRTPCLKKFKSKVPFLAPKQKGHHCGTCRRAGATVIFACGEFYCFAVVFGYRRVIFATRAWEANIISLRPQSCKATRSNITVPCNNITLTRSAYHFQFDTAFASTNAVLVRKNDKL